MKTKLISIQLKKTNSVSDAILLAPSLTGTISPKHGKIVNAKTVYNLLTPHGRNELLETLSKQKDSAVSKESIRGIMENIIPNHELILLAGNNGIINGGILLVFKKDNSVFLSNLWTNPKKQGKGTFLMESLFAWAKSTKIWKLQLESDHSALGFYLKLLPSRVFFEIRRSKPLLEFTIFPKTLDQLSPEILLQQTQQQRIIFERTEAIQQTIATLRKGIGYYLLETPAGTVSFNAPARIHSRTGSYLRYSFISTKLSAFERITEDLIFVPQTRLLRRITSNQFEEVVPPNKCSIATLN